LRRRGDLAHVAELRINTKGGGVIVGDVERDAIHLTLPGYKKMTFIKIQ
jgi:hypothetical protein